MATAVAATAMDLRVLDVVVVGHKEVEHGDLHDASGKAQDNLVVHNLEGVAPSCPVDVDASFLVPYAEAVVVSSSLVGVVPSLAV